MAAFNTNNVYKVIIFIGTIVWLQQQIINHIHPKTWLPQNHPTTKELLTTLNGIDKEATIFFGDSTTVHVAIDDPKPKKNIPDLVMEKSATHLFPLTHDGYSAPIYQAILEYLIHHDRTPKLIIVPINLNSFSPSWEPQPAIHLPELVNTLRLEHTNWYHLIYRPLQLYHFSQTNHQSAKHYAHPITYKGIVFGRVKDLPGNNPNTYSDYNMRFTLAARYLQPISFTNPHRLALNQIAFTAHKYHIQTIFYFTPIDFQTGEKFVGPEFTQTINQTIESITSGLTPYNPTIINLSQSVVSRDFDWQMYPYPNEHLKHTGRTIVVSYLVSALNAITKLQTDL